MRENKGITVIKLTIIILVVLIVLAIVGIVLYNKTDLFQGLSGNGIKEMKQSTEMIDKNNNEWVWIEVPKTIYATAKDSTDYINIEKDMRTYTGWYQKEEEAKNKLQYRIDEWKEEKVSDEEKEVKEKEYTELKNKMLSSVYEKEGFWISKYEIGTETQRADWKDSIEGEENKPLSQKDKYAYNYVSFKTAKALASQMTDDEKKTSSLMFGIQWDLTLKYLEENTNLSKDELVENSTSWGNYGNLTKTGVVDKHSVLGIYDLAGNVWEWTLEKIALKFSTSSIKPHSEYNIARGGSTGRLVKNDFEPTRDDMSVASFEYIAFTGKNTGFRATIF